MQQKLQQNESSTDSLPPVDSKKKKVRKFERQSWTLDENRLYVTFLKQNIELMKTAQSRKTNKIFKKLSAFILTRSSIQVKSHHQKLILKYKNIQSIIREVENEMYWAQFNNPQDKIIQPQNDIYQPQEYISQPIVQELQLPSLHPQCFMERLRFVGADNDYSQIFDPHQEYDIFEPLF